MDKKVDAVTPHKTPHHEDPDAILRQKFRAKCRFRAIVRLVMINNYWLSESVEEYDGLDNVKRRVEQAMRAKTKKKQLLNINDKALLNKPAADRTDAEKKYIYRIIGGLKCFKRYPDHVKRKLAAVTYFKYYGPDRVIVRQNQEAHAMYFIVTGDITISILIYDELLQKSAPIDVGQMHPGDMFGEVSLLHNIKRTATCTTSGHCEFLALMKEDFKNVLQASLQKQWDEIRLAMSSFTYFDNYDEVALREGCIVAKLKRFKWNDTIMGDGVGVPNYVYFVLSGRCQMVETLQVKVTKNKLGTEFYSLYDPFVRTSEGTIDFDEKYFKNRSQANQNAQPECAQTESDELKKQTDSIEKPERSDSIEKPDESDAIDNPEDIHPLKLGSASKLRFDVMSPKCSKDMTDKVSDHFTIAKSVSKLLNLASSQNINELTEQESTILEPQKQESHESIKFDYSSKLPKNVHTYFMQVCQFNSGATFGFGEDMRDRRIIALSNVTCMIMPYIWLMQRNTVNIWSRIEHYLTRKIPTKKKLFQEFVSQRRWAQYRENTLNSVISRTSRVNFTTISDVPYAIRMEELLDL